MSLELASNIQKFSINGYYINAVFLDESLELDAEFFLELESD